jgi:ornithine carbamoyltransferase
MIPPRHFINLHDLSRDEFTKLINRAIDLKTNRNPDFQPLKGKVLAMIFEKSSTRTRISFEVGIAQLGGSTLFLSFKDTQLGRGESLSDSAKVISSMVDGIIIRSNSHETVTTFAHYSQVPIINALTDLSHPCQLLADMQTYFELQGDITGKTVCWIGDGNNMCHSYIDAAILLNFNLHIVTPKNYQPLHSVLQSPNEQVQLFDHIEAAVDGANLVVTDVWASMGQEQELQARKKLFKAYQVTADIMARADKDALFMHCLPAHRGEEVTEDVIDSKQSVVFMEAENKLHAQKALLEFLIRD